MPKVNFTECPCCKETLILVGGCSGEVHKQYTETEFEPELDFYFDFAPRISQELTCKECGSKWKETYKAVKREILEDTRKNNPTIRRVYKRRK